MSSNSCSSPALKWEKLNKWYAETTCGRFSCRKRRPGDLADDKGNLIFEGTTVMYQLYDERKLRLGPPQATFLDVERMAQACALGSAA